MLKVSLISLRILKVIHACTVNNPSHMSIIIDYMAGLLLIIIIVRYMTCSIDPTNIPT